MCMCVCACVCVCMCVFEPAHSYIVYIQWENFHVKNNSGVAYCKQSADCLKVW